MRITNELMTGTSIGNLSGALERLYELQQKAATGKKYARASENPAIASQGMSLRSTLNSIETFQNTQASTKTWLETTDFASQQMVKTLGNVNNLLLKALNGLDDKMTSQERRVIGEEINGLLQQAVDVANTQDRGRYIFSGLRTDVKPFVFDYVTQEYPYLDNQTYYVANPTGGSNWSVPGTISGSMTVTSASYFTSGSDITGASITISGSPIYTRQVVKYLGDGNNIMRDVAPNETMTVSMSGSYVFGNLTSACNTGGSQINVSQMFDTLIHVRDLLMGEDYIQPNTDIEIDLDPTTGSATTIPPTSTNNPPTFPNHYFSPVLRGLMSDDYGKMQDYFELVSEKMNTNGARMENLAKTVDRADKAQLEIKALLSQNEEVNMAEIISLVQNQTTVYQTVLNISGRTNSMMSLFDTLG